MQDEVALSERVTLLFGARYDDLSYYLRDHITPTLDASRRFTRVTPRGGVNWRLASGTNLYASYGSGVEIPAGNETDPPPTGIPGPTTALNPLLDPILSTTLEAGVRRYVSMDGPVLRGLFIDAALYQVLVKGEPVPYNGGRFYLTAGEVQRRGLELALTGHIAQGMTVRFAGTFSRNTYERYVVDSLYLGAPGASVVLDGNRIAGLPARVINVSTNWQPPGARGLTLEIGAQRNSAYFADDRNLVRVPGFTVLRASASVERTLASSVSLKVSLSAENLTDKGYVASAFINPDYVAGQPAVYEAGLPRSLLFGLSLRRVR